MGEYHLEYRKHLRDKNFMGDHGHIHVTHTFGGQEQVFRPFEAQKLHWVILGPRRIFLLPEYGLYPVLCGVTAFACDHGYGLIFF